MRRAKHVGFARLISFSNRRAAYPLDLLRKVDEAAAIQKQPLRKIRGGMRSVPLKKAINRHVTQDAPEMPLASNRRLFARTVSLNARRLFTVSVPKSFFRFCGASGRR